MNPHCDLDFRIAEAMDGDGFEWTVAVYFDCRRGELCWELWRWVRRSHRESLVLREVPRGTTE